MVLSIIQEFRFPTLHQPPLGGTRVPADCWARSVWGCGDDSPQASSIISSPLGSQSAKFNPPTWLGRAFENTAHALLFHTLLGRARGPLGVRNHCESMLLGHLAFEITARASFIFFDGSRKHRTCAVFSHIGLEVTARACSAATGRSKSLFERVSKLFSAQDRCSSKLLRTRQHSKTP